MTYNRGRDSGFADGIVITSHNPPDGGGFSHNGGPTDTQTIGWTACL